MNFIKFRAHASMCASVESNKIDGVPNSPQQTTQVMKLGGNVGFTLEYQNLVKNKKSNIATLVRLFKLIEDCASLLGVDIDSLKTMLGELLQNLAY